MNDKTIALLRSLFAVDEKGNTYLRVTTSEPTGELSNAVSGQSNRSLETLLNNSIVLDENGNPALRLATVEFGQTLQEADNAKRKKMREEKAARLKKQAAEQKKANKKAAKK